MLPQWTVFGAFPPLPPERQEITFRMPAAGGLIVHTDGLTVPISAESTGWLYACDDFGGVSDLTEFAIGRAFVDFTQAWWFLGSGGTGADYTSDVLNWSPAGHAAPAIAAGSLQMIVPGWLWNAQLKQNTWSFFVSYDEGWQMADAARARASRG